MKDEYAKTVKELLDDLDGRSGFDLCNIDGATMNEWRREWREILQKRLVPRPEENG